MERNSGFTLVELMMVIFIIGFISTIGIASYTTFNARKVTESETKKVVEYLELSQSKTESGDRPSGCGTYAGYYTTSLTGSTLSVTPSGCSAITSYTIEDFSFPEGDFTVDYLPLGKGISGDTCILIQHPTADYCGKVEIEQSGIVKDDVVSVANCTCP